MSVSCHERDPVEVLAAEYVERQRRGEHPTVDEYAAQHPHLSSRIREIFPAIAVVEKLKAERSRRSIGRSLPTCNALERLGDYRLIGEIGRGGMAIVYEAEHEPLGRRVAVKVLPKQSFQTSKRLQRFEREAQTAAKLHHSNIVPVFDFGEHGGFRYIVMQYIDGVALNEVIQQLGMMAGGEPGSCPSDERSRQSYEIARELLADRPSQGESIGTSYWHWVAEIGIQAASALHYAHAHQTLHRDVKPSNLLLDTSGTLWVSDFGLAKSVGGDDISTAEEIVGTLAYMAPEQFHEQSDERSDIYGLGLTLYELLTLKPAYGGADQREVIRQVTQCEPVRASNIRSGIPRDLETIVLKAMSRAPGDRYKTASELAADLKRFVDDRPIRARRATAVERLWKCCRRNPVVATLSAVAVGLLILVTATASIGYMRELHHRAETEATLTISLEALEKVYERFAKDRIGAPSQPMAVSPETEALLEDLLLFYDRFAAHVSNDSKLQAEQAQASNRIGGIHLRLGKTTAAERAYIRAIKAYQKLAHATSDPTRYRNELAHTYVGLGNVYHALGMHLEVHHCYLSAWTLLKKEVTESSSHEARYELARVCYLVSRKPDHPEVDLSLHADGFRGPPHLSTEHPPHLPPRRPGRKGGPPHPPGVHPPGVHPPGVHPPGVHPPGIHPPGVHPPKSSPTRMPQPGDFSKMAIDLASELHASYPDVPDYEYLLALGKGSSRHRPTIRQSTEILERLCREHPEVDDYRYALCEMYSTFTLHKLQDSELEAAEKRLRAALDCLDERDQDVNWFRVAKVQTNFKLASLLRRVSIHKSGDERSNCLREAESLCREALRLDAMLAETSDASRSAIWKAAINAMLAEILSDRGDLSQARSLLQESVEELRGVSGAHPDSWHVAALLVETIRSFARILEASGEDELARQAKEEALNYERVRPTLPPYARPHAPRPTSRDNDDKL